MISSPVGNTLQVFAPDPSKSLSVALPYTWTPVKGTKVYTVQATGDTVQKLNLNTVGLTLATNELSGPFGLHPSTYQITFSGAGTLVIESD